MQERERETGKDKESGAEERVSLFATLRLPGKNPSLVESLRLASGSELEPA